MEFNKQWAETTTFIVGLYGLGTGRLMSRDERKAGPPGNTTVKKRNKSGWDLNIVPDISLVVLKCRMVFPG